MTVPVYTSILPPPPYYPPQYNGSQWGPPNVWLPVIVFIFCVNSKHKGLRQRQLDWGGRLRLRLLDRGRLRLRLLDRRGRLRLRLLDRRGRLRRRLLDQGGKLRLRLLDRGRLRRRLLDRGRLRLRLLDQGGRLRLWLLDRGGRLRRHLLDQGGRLRLGWCFSKFGPHFKMVKSFWNAENEVYLSLKIKHSTTNSQAIKSEACTVHCWLVRHHIKL